MSWKNFNIFPTSDIIFSTDINKYSITSSDAIPYMVIYTCRYGNDVCYSRSND